LTPSSCCHPARMASIPGALPDPPLPPRPPLVQIPENATLSPELASTPLEIGRDRLTKRLIVCWRCSRCRISQPATPYSPFISSCTCLLSLSWQFVPNLAPKLPMWSGAGNLNKWRTKVDSAINLLNSKYWKDHSWVCSIVIVELFIMGLQIDLKFRLILHRQWA